MQDRLDQFEAFVRGDSNRVLPNTSPLGLAKGESASSLPRVPSFGQVSEPGSFASVCYELQQGTVTEGEKEVASAAPGGSSCAVQDVIEKLLYRATNPHDMVLAELRRFKEVPLKDWPLPKGYQSRIAPAYIAHVYGRGKLGEEHGESYIQAHGLEDCHPARQLLTHLGHLDRLLMVDRKEGFINDISTEYLTRQAYGLELAFAHCKCKSDWLKPRSNPPKDWRSKVDWDIYHRTDPRSAKTSGLNIREAEDEVRAEIDRDATLLKSRAKLAAHTPASGSIDPLNL